MYHSLHRRSGTVLCGLLVLASAGTARADRPDKSGYSLTRPTPVELLREMSTDRPDQTESPYTVDAGRWQVELDVVNVAFDHDKAGGADVRTRELAVAPLNLKVGLRHNVDLQLMIDPYVRTTLDDRVAGTRERADGFGDITTRVKINFWGNDGGSTAFALMPFVKWPLSASAVRNGHTEGGLIAILGYELPGGWGSAFMTEVDFVRNDAGGRQTDWINSITFSHDLTERLGGYVELFTVSSNAPGTSWQAQFDIGLTYALAKDVQLDLGCNFGVTRSAPDYQPFLGISRRF